MTGEAKSLTIEEGGENKEVELPDKCHSLRLRSIRKRIETERNRSLDKSSKDVVAPATTRSGKKRRSRRAAPLSRYRRKTANARERDRMRHVNDAFEKLKDSIPHHTLFQQVEDKKDTKVTTLRCAITYINSLSSLLDDLNCGRDVDPAYRMTDQELGIDGVGSDEDDNNNGKSRRNKGGKKKKGKRKGDNKKNKKKGSSRQTRKTNSEKFTGVKRQGGAIVNGGGRQKKKKTMPECLSMGDVTMEGGGGLSLLRYQHHFPATPQPCSSGLAQNLNLLPPPLNPPPPRRGHDVLHLLPRVPLEPSKCGSYCSSSPSSSPSPPASVASNASSTFPFLTSNNNNLMEPSLTVEEEVIIEDTDHPIMGADCFVAGQINNKPTIEQPQQQQQQLQVECSATVLQELLTSIEAFEAATSNANSVYIVQTDFSGLDQVVSNQT